MNYHPDRSQSSSGAAVVAGLILALLLFVGLTVLAVGGWLVLSTRYARQEATVQMEIAKQEAEVARARAAFEVARATELDAGESDSESPTVVIQIDPEGTLRVDGEIVALVDLKSMLSPDDAVQIAADRRCRFQAVADVLELCAELGVEDVQAVALQES